MTKWTTIIFLLCVLIGTVGCDESGNNTNIQQAVTIYLVNAEVSGLIPIGIELKAEKLEYKIQEVFNLLKSGTDSAKASVARNIELTAVKIADKNAVLTFTESYYEAGAIEEILSRSAIVESITSLEEIDTVEFFIGSVPYQDSSGAVFGPMSDEDIVLDVVESVQKSPEKSYSLFFANAEGTHLVPVKYLLALKPSEQLELAIVNLLIKGPDSEMLSATIPKEAKVNAVYTNEGVCYVDFNKEFMTKHMGGSMRELLTIYSVVNTLSELPNVSKVQFLIDGTIEKEFKGHIAFNVLFQSNLDLIEKTE